jgi:CubicO group peptidase (beta-lactamase class C family)
MTHTSGLGSGGAAGRETNRVAPRNTAENLAAHVPKLGAAPLDFQPGAEWRYSDARVEEILDVIAESRAAIEITCVDCHVNLVHPPAQQARD